MRTRFLTVALVALASAALLTAACGGDDDSGGSSKTVAANAQTIAVTAKDFSFDNTNLTAKAGQPVHLTFKNTGNAEHSFTIDNVVDTEAEKGDTKTADFTAPSQTVQFRCKYHPTQMKGTLTIGS